MKLDGFNLLIISLLLATVGNLALVRSLGFAAEGRSVSAAGVSQYTQPPKAQVQENSPHANPCVLLTNDNLLFGVAKQVGPFVMVQTGQGSEIKLNQDQVLCWADSPERLYRYRVDHRQKNDVTAMIRDVRWCIRYGLFEIAAYELMAIRRIDPKSAEVDLVEQQLKRQWKQKNQQPILKPGSNPESSATEETQAVSKMTAFFPDDPSQGKALSPSSQEKGRRSDAHRNENFIAVADALENKPNILRFFASHIQPMLGNRCGVCHAYNADQSQETGWQLNVPTVGSRASAVMTRENLHAVLSFIEQSEPKNSRLYMKATTAHGGRQAGLTARNSAAIDSLASWIKSVSDAVVGERFAAEESNAPFESQQTITADQRDAIGTDPPGSAKDSLEKGSLASLSNPPTSAFYQPKREVPSRLPLVNNPFDPQLFNRRYDLQAVKTNAMQARER